MHTKHVWYKIYHLGKVGAGIWESKTSNQSQHTTRYPRIASPWAEVIFQLLSTQTKEKINNVVMSIPTD